MKKLTIEQRDCLIEKMNQFKKSTLHPDNRIQYIVDHETVIEILNYATEVEDAG